MNGLVNCFQESDKENLFEKNTNMANLSIPEITKDERVEYRSTLLVEKVFKKNTLENNFMTDKGLFHATSILINGREYTTYSSDLGNTIIGLRGTRSRLELKGKLVGSKFEEVLSINNIEKGEEFGGQPAGGKRQNKGIIFEDELYNRLAECIRGTTCKGKYARQAKHILDATSSAIGSPVIDVELEGGKNKPRPLILDGNNPIIKPKEPSGHGELLTDITLKHENGKFSYLSLKYESTLTFVNAGVQAKHFPSLEIKGGEIKNKMGTKILEALGIDNNSFCDVFNKYGKTSGKPMVSPHKVDVSKKVNKQMLKKFVQTAIGANYWMVHGMPGGQVYFWKMSSGTKNSEMATIGGKIELLYGGSNGMGKRIDMTFKNSFFEYKLNIRNKQGGLYPSHLMMDYKSLGATGKILLKD